MLDAQAAGGEALVSLVVGVISVFFVVLLVAAFVVAAAVVAVVVVDEIRRLGSSR